MPFTSAQVGQKLGSPVVPAQADQPVHGWSRTTLGAPLIPNARASPNTGAGTRVVMRVLVRECVAVIWLVGVRVRFEHPNRAHTFDADLDPLGGGERDGPVYRRTPRVGSLRGDDWP